ncbi:hypothetical protein Tco_1565239 [Tanacetum coccineum]
MTTKGTFGKQRKTRRRKKIEDDSSVVIQITSLVIVPNTPSMTKRRSLLDVGVIVKMIPRRKIYVSWLLMIMSSSLQEMLEMQKPPKNKRGIGYTDDIVYTSNTKPKKLDPKNVKMLFVELASPVPSTREPASSDEQNRLSTAKMENAKNLRNNIVKKDDSMLVTRKPSFNISKSVKQPPILKLGQGLGM